MKNKKKIFIILLSVIITAAPALSQTKEAPLKNEPTCKEITGACTTALELADELIKANEQEILYLKETNKTLLDQIDTKDQKILDLSNKPWYSSPTTIFLLGIIAGGLAHEKFINNR